MPSRGGLCDYRVVFSEAALFTEANVVMPATPSREDQKLFGWLGSGL
jgi:hypothetical protein